MDPTTVNTVVGIIGIISTAIGIIIGIIGGKNYVLAKQIKNELIAERAMIQQAQIIQNGLTAEDIIKVLKNSNEDEWNKIVQYIEEQLKDRPKIHIVNKVPTKVENGHMYTVIEDLNT